MYFQAVRKWAHSWCQTLNPPYVCWHWQTPLYLSMLVFSPCCPHLQGKPCLWEPHIWSGNGYMTNRRPGTHVYIDLWEKDDFRHSRGIMHVWDTGAVPINRYRPLLRRWLEECSSPQINWYSQAGHGKEGKILLKHQPHLISSFIWCFIDLGIFWRPHPWRVKVSWLLANTKRTMLCYWQ